MSAAVFRRLIFSSVPRLSRVVDQITPSTSASSRTCRCVQHAIISFAAQINMFCAFMFPRLSNSLAHPAFPHSLPFCLSDSRCLTESTASLTHAASLKSLPHCLILPH